MTTIESAAISYFRRQELKENALPIACLCAVAWYLTLIVMEWGTRGFVNG